MLVLRIAWSLVISISCVADLALAIAMIIPQFIPSYPILSCLIYENSRPEYPHDSKLESAMDQILHGTGDLVTLSLSYSMLALFGNAKSP